MSHNIYTTKGFKFRVLVGCVILNLSFIDNTLLCLDFSKHIEVILHGVCP